MNPRQTDLSYRNNNYLHTLRPNGSPDLLFIHYESVRDTQGGSYSYRRTEHDVVAGLSCPLRHLRSGTEFRTEDGRVGIVVSLRSRTALVRWTDDGTPERVSTSVVITPTRQTVGYGNIFPGEFVRVLNGPHQGRTGLVSRGGTNSNHVYIPGEDQVSKIAAKDLQIIDAQIVPV